MKQFIIIIVVFCIWLTDSIIILLLIYYTIIITPLLLLLGLMQKVNEIMEKNYHLLTHKQICSLLWSNARLYNERAVYNYDIGQLFMKEAIHHSGMFISSVSVFGVKYVVLTIYEIIINEYFLSVYNYLSIVYLSYCILSYIVYMLSILY